MKRKLIFTTVMSIVCINAFYAQQVVINEKLLSQLTKNQTVRMQSDNQFYNSYEKQVELYNDIKAKVTQIVAIQQYIYDKLTNVHEALRQGKKMQYLAQYLGKIPVNASEMVSLMSKNPEYAPLYGRYYNHIIEEVLKLKKEIQEIFTEEHDFLMDPYDREILINKVYHRAREINGTIVYINLLLKNAKKIPYLYQVPILNNYVSQDRAIIKTIIYKYNSLK